ncbi:MAG TPA: hypothetical protein ENJ37_00665 [Deltaproteobacteria bacterium]|nr:hypothetical protein [Deltaproteobacteria bacterium]
MKGGGIVITGRGVVSPAGAGKDGLRGLLREGRRALGEVEAFDAPCEAGEIKSFDLLDHVDDRRLRRAAPATQYVAAAVAEALGEAGIAGEAAGTGTGLVTAVTHGAVGFTCLFHRDLVIEGPLAASPALFSDSVLNAPAGNTAMAFAVRGPVHTIVGAAPAGLQAVELAVRLVASGRVERCIAAATEELNERVVEAYFRMGLISPEAAPFGPARKGFLPGEGAAAVVVERMEAAARRGAAPLAAVASAAGDGGPSLEEALGRICAPAAGSAGTAATADLLVSGANGGPADAVEGRVMGALLPEGTAVRGLKALTGEAFCASALTSLVAATFFLEEGEGAPSGAAPQDVSTEWSWADFTAAAAAREVLVTATGLRGEAAAVRLAATHIRISMEGLAGL